mgnify:FL=1
MTAQTLRLANAGAQLPRENQCPRCHGYGAMSSQELVGIHGADPMYGCDYCQSIGEGWVYALPDAVRVPCERRHTLRLPGQNRKVSTCNEIGCRGWVPATDGWVWLRATMPLRVLVVGCSTNASNHKDFAFRVGEEFAELDDPELAFHTALNKALTAKGARFP